MRHLPNNPGLESAAAHGLHHGQMFEIIVRLEQRIASEELDQDTANAPYVAWVAPSEVKDDFGCSVMSC